MIGPLTYLDVALIAVAFISGLLAMYRGFARELLSILSWIAAAGVGYWIFATKKDMTAEIAAQTSLPPQVATIAVAVVVALIVLIIVHLITARISDAILDSQVGMIDRILGFIFGVLRGFLLFVIPYMAYEAFISPDKEKQHPMVRDAYFRDYVKSTGEAIRSVLLQVIPQPSAAPGTTTPAEPPTGGQQGALQQKGRSVALVIKGQRYYMTVA
jgi:membrane protein required for colicin V production